MQMDADWRGDSMQEQRSFVADADAVTPVTTVTTLICYFWRGEAVTFCSDLARILRTTTLSMWRTQESLQLPSLKPKRKP